MSLASIPPYFSTLLSKFPHLSINPPGRRNTCGFFQLHSIFPPIPRQNLALILTPTGLEGFLAVLVECRLHRFVRPCKESKESGSSDVYKIRSPGCEAGRISAYIKTQWRASLDVLIGDEILVATDGAFPVHQVHHVDKRRGCLLL